jgi:alkanesulfonate monooxygenase SsuD/methylene tetrahydromethanopterin reductase-like flavin-dependent oxidoreductase (luciferase family)
MRTWYFSENAYPYLPDDIDNLRVTIPSRLYDPEIGAGLYSRYFDEWQLADAEGLDLMVNEHHQTAINLNPAGPLVMAVLARTTRQARLLLLGNPIANRKDPVRVAEEMAMIDNYSRGRLEVGFVRGVPYEISAANANPMRTAERMWEAHDLILKAWTTSDGPFNWEGTYFQHRQVNIWPRPYQQPRPPVWITSLTPSSTTQIAERGHATATFLSGIGPTKRVFDAYRQRRAELGLPMAEDRLSYSGIVHVGDTDEAGFAGARKIMWVITHNRAAPQFRMPPGYAPAPAMVQALRGRGEKLYGTTPTLETLIEQGIAFAGNPDTVYRQIERHYNLVGGYGNLLMLGQSGLLEHEETESGIRLFAREVYPRLRELRLGAAK